MINPNRKIFSQARWQGIYLACRILLYFFFLLAVCFVTYQILFPEISLNYSFSSTNSLKNTLFEMRTSSQNQIKNGRIDNEAVLTFNANPLGIFENAKLQIVLDKNSKFPAQPSVQIRKSYQAFFYPLGESVNFSNGTLLSSNGIYYIVSAGKIRQFVSGAALDQLGFSRQAFLRVSQAELAINPKGEDILKADTYPDDALIAVDGQYFQFKNQQLIPFLSDKAFLSRYQATQAIPKDETFLKKYPVLENFIGFADGTLASSDQSVFILSKGLSYPIADSATFLAMGFSWDSVLPLTPAEINAYKRQKQFTVNQPHPDGTIFYDQQAEETFLIENGKKRPLKNSFVAASQSTNASVLVNSQSLEKRAFCKLTKAPITLRTLECDLDLKNISHLLGNDYQFEIDFGQEVKLQTAQVVFFTKFSQANTLTSLSLIKTRLQNNYVQN
ncbi:MAG: hypothetical protein WCJ51_00415 [Candidatus Moraniibacteriota bacterium]